MSMVSDGRNPGPGPDAMRQEQYLTAEEAAVYLGIAAREFGSLAEQYGIGRRYLVDPRPKWAYAKADVDRIKAGLASRPAPPQPVKESPTAPATAD